MYALGETRTADQATGDAADHNVRYSTPDRFGPCKSAYHTSTRSAVRCEIIYDVAIVMQGFSTKKNDLRVND